MALKYVPYFYEGDRTGIDISAYDIMPWEIQHVESEVMDAVIFELHSQYSTNNIMTSYRLGVHREDYGIYIINIKPLYPYYFYNIVFYLH